MSETLSGETDRSRIDEEDIRLTTGFADIFTTLVLVIGASALLALAGPFGGLLMIGAAFALGKPIVRAREFAAASSALAIGVAFGAGTLGAAMVGLFGLLLAAGLCAVYWRGFKVPIALALAWALLIFTATALPVAGLEDNLEAYTRVGALGLVCGGALFGLGLWYDYRDRTRTTRLSDVAFWLHLGAAPLLVHGLFAVTGVDPFSGEVADPWFVLAVFAVLTLTSLVIDRRPLLISSFIYLLIAVGTLLTRWQGETDEIDRFTTAALAPAVIGAFLLVLAAAWSPLRRAILCALPERLTRFVPPPVIRPAAAAEEFEAPAAEKEPLRLVLGFNDIFVSAGSTTMFFGCLALAWFLTRSSLQAADDVQILFSATPWIWIGLPGLSLWLVAEYFVRVRRMAWPAVTSGVWFCLVSAAAGYVTAAQILLPWGAGPGGLAHGFDLDALPPAQLAAFLLVGCLTAAAGNLAFWRRQRTPISFALAVACLLPLLFVDTIAGSDSYAPDPDFGWTLRWVWGGLAVFCLAVLWDRADAERKTQRADTAFWLHLLASALVIPPLALQAMDLAFGPIVIAGGFVPLIGVAVALDRRAPLVVALPFVIAALGSGTGMRALATVALSLALLALVLRWDKVRTWLLSLLAREAGA